MKLIGLLLLALVSLVEGEEIANSRRGTPSFVTAFPAFFDRNTPVTPTVFRGAQFVQICQKYKNVYRYATLYDTRNRIPVYSAYTYAGYAQTTRSGSWMIEPQLDDPRALCRDGH
ncbi:hypothetical protein AALO_G00089890 [Alosa alosa]|uniref:Uncharacterized protein n=1 Tax=Alosa alosa TaxID=278164 RepID=A0AAV6GVU8_9TELE|nr:hypothetical protein AALO_G00089890 [Alosa alosa]